MTFYYKNHVGKTIDLMSWPIMIQDPESLFKYNWNYTSGVTIKRLTAFKKAITERECTLSIFADSEEEFNKILNDILEVTDFDVTNEQPGKLYYKNYYLDCYIIAGGLEEWEPDFETTDKKIKIASQDGKWIKETTIPFRWQEQEVDTSGKAYPYNYPYNYGMGTGYTSEIEIESISDMDFVLTIYGYINKPEISIGSNTYMVDHEVAPNEELVINSRDRTIYLINRPTGIVKSMFRYRSKDFWIFEKIPSGILPVYWNGAYDFDLKLLEERSEPKWT